jgi:hypothetical protein
MEDRGIELMKMLINESRKPPPELCKSCGGEMKYDPKTYSGGYWCPNAKCPAGQELNRLPKD